MESTAVYWVNLYTDKDGRVLTGYNIYTDRDLAKREALDWCLSEDNNLGSDYITTIQKET